MWIIGNVDYMGFYRTNYDDAMWNKLVKQLKTDHTVSSHFVSRKSASEELETSGLDSTGPGLGDSRVCRTNEAVEPHAKISRAPN